MESHIDIVICAVIAVLLFARLWSIFGRRNDEDRQRSNPFASSFLPVPKSNETPDDKARQPAPLFKLAPASLAGGLEQIKARLPDFEEKQFLREAKANFALIVESFAKNDMGRIARYLTPEVADHFQKALEARKASGQTAESKIIEIKEAETSSVWLEGDKAFIAVHFVSIQENILRDESGQVIGGGIGQFEEVTDRWTFTCDFSSSAKEWLLAETGV